MKKGIAVLLCLALVAFAFAGCRTESPTDSRMSETPDDSSSATHTSLPEDEVPEDNPPRYEWAFDWPENHGVDNAMLEALHAAASETDIYSIVIVKDGYIIDEFYNEGYSEDSVFRLASCTKTFSGALIGIAIANGQISGVDVELTEYFQTLAESDNTYKQQITLEHLLTHTSGMYWSEWNGGTMFGELVTSENWVEFVLEQPVVYEPGTTFNYTTGGSHLLAAVLEIATGESTYDYASEHLFRPLGMDSVEWRIDPQGVTDGGNGISMTARDAAKFGQLYLNGGMWDGEEIIPAEWVAQSIMRQSSGAGSSGAYGYQWWLRTFGEKEYDTYYAMGHGGQFIFVVPELNLVTVITSGFSSNTYAPWPYFTDYILAACE